MIHTSKVLYLLDTTNIQDFMNPIGGDKGNRFLVPSLFISQLSTRPVGILMGLILTDIALIYNTTVGVAGQIVTAASIAGMIITPFARAFINLFL